MTSLVSWGEFQRLKSENERLRAENRLLKTENQALKVKEGRNEVALDKFKKDIVYQQRREDERLRWLMKIIGEPFLMFHAAFPRFIICYWRSSVGRDTEFKPQHYISSRTCGSCHQPTMGQ